METGGAPPFFCQMGYTGAPWEIIAIDYLVKYSAFVKQRSDTKQRLLDAAGRLIWEQSYGAVSVDEICDQAGANKGKTNMGANDET